MVGVYTDGDLRRSLDEQVDVHTTAISTVMTSSFSTASTTQLAVEALNLMEEKSISAIPVLDDNQQLVGAINMHDLLKAGVV